MSDKKCTMQIFGQLLSFDTNLRLLLLDNVLSLAEPLVIPEIDMVFVTTQPLFEGKTGF